MSLRGFEYAFERNKMEVKAGETASLTVHLHPVIPYEPRGMDKRRRSHPT